MSSTLIQLLLALLPQLISTVEQLVSGIESNKGNVTEEQLTEIINSTIKLVQISNSALTASLNQSAATGPTVTTNSTGG